MMVREGRAQPRQSAQKPKSYEAYSFPAPTLGLMAMNNLAVAVPGAAQVLENWFPTPTGAIMRRGKQLYATLGNGDEPVTSMFSYVVGNQREFYATTANTIYDITTILSPTNTLIGTEDGDIIGTEDDDMIGIMSTDGLDVLSGFTGGNWVVVQFATAGTTFLIGVNGVDNGFIYDGTTFLPYVQGGVVSLPISGVSGTFEVGEAVTGGTSGATGTVFSVAGGELVISGPSDAFDNAETVTGGTSGATATAGTQVVVAPGVTGIATSQLAYVWIYKNRLWFIEKDSLNAWYLPVDQAGGTLTSFPLGGVLGKGGSLVFGATWSQDVGDGLNALCAFVSSEGEAAVYQGSNPSSATDWGIVGVYQTGKPLGNKAHVQVGGDIVMASDIAFVPLSEALRREYSQLGANSLSAPIEALWPEEVLNRGGANWHCALWTARQIIVVGLPTVDTQPPSMLVANSRTGKWARFTNWGSTCVHVFNDRLFIGDTNGRVFEANVTGLDDGAPYTATYLPSFDQMEKPGRKTVSMVRAVLRCAHTIKERMSVHTDYDIKLPAAPDASTPTPSSAWGTVTWGNFEWGSKLGKKVQQTWRNQFGAGEVASVGLQITSGSLVPLDAEIVRTDVLFTTGSVVT